MNTEEINRIRKEAIDAINKVADEALKQTPKVGDWFEADFNFQYIIKGRITKIENGKIHYFGYDFEINGWRKDWIKFPNKNIKSLRILTESEVIDFLTKEAEKKYKEGDNIVSVKTGKNVFLPLTDITCIANDYFIYKGMSVLDLQTGEWAEVVNKEEDFGTIEVENNHIKVNWNGFPKTGKYKLVKI